MNNLELIRSILQEKFDLKPSDITLETGLDQLGIDSLAVVELMFELEDRLKIKIPEEGLELKVVRDVVNALDQLTSGQSPTPAS